MRSHRFAALLFLSLALFAPPLLAQNGAVDLEGGVRWTEVEGNEDLYRTQINENDAVLIRSLSFFSSDFDGPGRGIIDHLRIDATDLAQGPASSLRIDAGRAKAYRLRAGYRTFELYSALPAFANPLLGQGILPGQHTWDRERRMLDVDLELLPFGEQITPFIGYAHSRQQGPGATTYFFSEDEFKLDSDLDETDNEIRLGSAFNFGRLYGSVTQGWRSFDSTERLTLSSGGGGGNNSIPVVGVDPVANILTRISETAGRTPFTSIAAAAQPFNRLRLTASYAKFSSGANSIDRERASGTFISFPVDRFFTGFEERVTSDSNNESWRGVFRGELELSPRIELMAGYRKEYRELGGTALIDSLFRNSITVSGEDPGDFRNLIDTESTFDRQIDTLEAAAAVRLFPDLTFRVGVAQSDYEIDIAEDLEEISIPGNQSGRFARNVRSLEGSATYANERFDVSASVLREDADRPVVRSDFLNRSRIRARAGFTSPEGMFRTGVSAEQSNQDNDSNDIGLDATVDEYTIDAEVAPRETFRIRAAWSKVRLDSVTTIRRPERSTLDTSRHQEDWGAMELGLATLGNPLSFDASATRLRNRGSLPYLALRYRARAIWQVHQNVSIAGEWSRDRYDEETESWAKFQGDRFGVFARYKPVEKR